MAKKILLIVAFILTFLLGVFTQKVLNTEGFLIDSRIQKLIEIENELLLCNTRNIINGSIWSADSTLSTSLLMRKTNLMLKYFDKFLLEGESYKDFSVDTLSSILKDVVKFKEYYEIANDINIKRYSKENATFLISLSRYILLNKCLHEYKKSSLMIYHADCICVPEKDTLKIGETYKTKIYLSITDLSKKHQIEMDNEIKLNDNVYIEKVTKSGLNKRKGLFKYFNGYETRNYPIEFSFYVK